MNPFLIVFGVIVFYLLNCVKILSEYERGVIFRLGRVISKPKGPGIIFVLVPIDKMVRISLRIVTLDVPPQDIITRDNVSVKVNAVIYYRVMDPVKAVIEIENFHFATSQMAQTSLRSVIGQSDFDDLLSKRDKINGELQTIIDRQTDPWGIKVSTVEIKHVDITEELRRAMARQAEAERERRGKVIAAEGEYQAAEKLVKAAEMMQHHPMSLQMRYLQTLVEIASENNSTIVFPPPILFSSIFIPPFSLNSKHQAPNIKQIPNSNNQTKKFSLIKILFSYLVIAIWSLIIIWLLPALPARQVIWLLIIIL